MHCDGTMSLRTEAPVIQPQPSFVLTTCAYRCDPLVPGILNANNRRQRMLVSAELRVMQDVGIQWACRYSGQ